MSRTILITGCSGGGKSTLLAALANEGYATVPEPGRRIVEAAQATGKTHLLPWNDMAAFAREALRIARQDLLDAQQNTGATLFDRGVIDAAVALEHSAGIPLATSLSDCPRYTAPIFLAPPWPEIYTTDTARQHDLSTAIAEYDRLNVALTRLGYAPVMLPKISPMARVDFVKSYLNRALA